MHLPALSHAPPSPLTSPVGAPHPVPSQHSLSVCAWCMRAVQVGARKEVLVLNQAAGCGSGWTPQPDPCPPPPPGALHLSVPRMALTWDVPCGAGCTSPVRFEAHLHAPQDALREGMHSWQGCPAVDGPPIEAGKPVLLARMRGRFLPTQLQKLHVQELRGEGGAPPLGRAMCSFQVRTGESKRAHACGCVRMCVRSCLCVKGGGCCAVLILRWLLPLCVCWRGGGSIAVHAQLMHGLCAYVPAPSSAHAAY